MPKLLFKKAHIEPIAMGLYHQAFPAPLSWAVLKPEERHHWRTLAAALLDEGNDPDFPGKYAVDARELSRMAGTLERE